MARITPGRYTANIDGDFVVFHIGMRINKFWKVHKWLPVARAMGPMLRTLSEHPEKGLLAFESSPGCATSPSSSTGARSSNSSSSLATPPIHTSNRGGGSTPRLAPTVTSASGTRPTRWRRTATSASTTTCRASVLLRPASMSPSLVAVNGRANVCTSARFAVDACGNGADGVSRRGALRRTPACALGRASPRPRRSCRVDRS